MKAFRLIHAFYGALALVMVTAPIAYSQQRSSVQIPRPSVNGPSLGDPTTNIDSIAQGLQNNTFSNVFSYTTFTVAAGNTTSTVLQPGFNFLTGAVGTTGTMSLPTAKPGTNIVVVNNTGVGVLLFGNGSNPFTAGGIDYVQGKVSSGTGAPATATYVLTNGFVTDCYVPQGGNWWCQAGSN